MTEKTEKKDILCEDTIKTLLNSSVFNVQVIDETDSTNTLVRELAERGEKEGLIVIAKKQNNGKGRMGRKFHSPNDSGLYMSILLRPPFSPEETLFITCAAAVSVCRATEKYTDKKMGIKWVNDIYSGGKKVCGILTESALSPDGSSLSYAVLGIGINVYEPDGGFDPEIQNIAGSIFKKNEETENLKNKIAASVISEFFKLYYGENKKSFLSEYKERSVLIGERVTVMQGGSEKNATVLFIDDNLNLCVKYDDGKTSNLNSGEVSIKRLKNTP